MASPTGRSRTGAAGRAVLVGLGVGIGCGLIVFFFVAIPYLTLARFESNGLGRPLIQTGLFQVSVYAGLIAGVASSIAAGWWWHRSHRTPRDRGLEAEATAPRAPSVVGGDHVGAR